MSAFLLLAVFIPAAAISKVGGDASYDVVILNGRVVDPESGLDAPGMNVGIRGGTIVKITKEPINGKVIIEAEGRVIAPGFIDVLSYDPNPYGIWYKISDGVTTNLALHGGAVNINAWIKAFEGKTPANYGAGFFYNAARASLGAGERVAASVKQIEKLKVMAEKAIKDGALSIGMSLEYFPGTSVEEVDAMMTIAAKYDVPVFFHVRYSDMDEPGTNFDALKEVIDAARRTKAAIHIDHINSTGGTFSMPESIKMLKDAIGEGLDITACIYPYDYWATYLSSARFDEGWQKRFKIGYNDLQLGGSTERLTKESFGKYRKLGKLAVAYAIPEADVIEALKAPFVMIGSDGIINPGNNNHPRGAGAFTRTIRLYSNEKKTITLMEAIAKMTILPAKRLEKGAPVFKKKGRVSVGADADIILFHPEKVEDTATVVTPNSFSNGMDYVLVNGHIVKAPKGLLRERTYGGALRSGKAN